MDMYNSVTLGEAQLRFFYSKIGRKGVSRVIVEAEDTQLISMCIDLCLFGLLALFRLPTRCTYVGPSER